jgi:NADPH:quinone reductase
MKSVVIDSGSLVLSERDTPTPGPGDVLIRVHAAGLNAADLMQRLGFYPAPPGWPQDIPGLELAGEVIELGEGVSPSLLNKRVCAIVGGGGQSTHCIVPAEHLTLVPDVISYNEAGGFAEAFTTAFDALVRQGHLTSGDRVLISGASGGVGTAAIQIASALGAHVIAVTRTPEHHELLKQLGANETIIIEQVASIDRVNVVLELVGAAHLNAAQHVLAPSARIVVIGVGGGGSTAELNLLNFMSTRATLTGSTLRARSREEKAEVIAHVNKVLLPLWQSGKLKVLINKSFEIEEVQNAYDFFAERGKLGKVILSIA